MGRSDRGQGVTDRMDERATRESRNHDAALYDILHSAIYPATPDKIGTVLARALTDHIGPDTQGHDLQYFAKPLRASLRQKLITYLDTLRDQWP